MQIPHLRDQRAQLANLLGPRGERVRRPDGVAGAFEHRRERPRIGRLAGERDRLIGQRTAPGALRFERQLLGQQRQQPRVAGRLRRVVELERPLERRDPLQIDAAVAAHETAVVRERRAGGEVCVPQLRCDSRRLQERLAVGRHTRLPLRLAEPDQRLGPGSGRGRTKHVERVAEQLCGLARREAVERSLPGPQRVVGCSWPVDRHRGQPPVHGQLAQMLVGIGAVQLLDGLGDSVVEPRTAGPSQPLVQRVIDQRVLEVEPSDHIGRLTQQ